jgi:hypothetical protein
MKGAGRRSDDGESKEEWSGRRLAKIIDRMAEREKESERRKRILACNGSGPWQSHSPYHVSATGSIKSNL